MLSRGLRTGKILSLFLQEYTLTLLRLFWGIDCADSQVTAILVLAGLPRIMAGAILAHECMHAFLRLSGATQLPRQIEEGLCQLMAVLWLGSLAPAPEVPLSPLSLFLQSPLLPLFPYPACTSSSYALHLRAS